MCMLATRMPPYPLNSALLLTRSPIGPGQAEGVKIGNRVTFRTQPMTHSQMAQGGDRGGAAGCGVQTICLSHGWDPWPIIYLTPGWLTWFPIRSCFVSATPESPLPFAVHVTFHACRSQKGSHRLRVLCVHMLCQGLSLCTWFYSKDGGEMCKMVPGSVLYTCYPASKI